MKKIVIIGGGTAGIGIAAKLLRENKNIRIDLFEPSEYHYYQPLYTLVGAGADKKEKTKRRTKDIIPKGANWIRRKVSSFNPDQNEVISENGERHAYDYLIVAPGLQIDWHLVEGLTETLGKNGVCSIYGYNESEDTFKTLEQFTGGKAIFTAGSTPVKCGGAAQKIMYLADSYFRKKGIRDNAEVHFASAGTKLFGVEGYTEALQKVVDKKDIKTDFFHRLVRIDGANKKAYFEVKLFENEEQTGTEERCLDFDMLHVVPPQSAPDFIKESPLAIKDGKPLGWLDVDHFSMQHNQYDNVFGLGDVCGLPTAKTGASVRKQLPVVAKNIQRLINGKPIDPNVKYNGYSACPILTDYHHVVMAEFVYGNKPKSSFFFNTRKPLYSMYLMKHYFLPWFYWNMMMKGRDLPL